MLESLISVRYCFDYLLNQISINLLLYTHLPAAILSLVFGSFILYKTRKLEGVTLFIVCLSFTAWCLMSLSTWFAFLGSGNTMVTWILIDPTSLIFFLFSYYFLYVFTTGKDLPNWQKIIGIVIVLPTFIYTFFGSSLSGYNANYCEAIEKESVTAYLFYAQGFILLSTIILTVVNYRRTKDSKQKKKTLLAGLGIIVFLSFFFCAILSVSLLADNDFVQYAYNFEIYGLLGMPILLGFLSFLIVRYQAFNVKLIGAQALVFALIALIASQFFFIRSQINLVLTGITLSMIIVFGGLLIRGVEREIKQKEEMERLAKNLAKSNHDLEIANEKLKELDKQKTEFVSLASHQLRSPLTAIKGYSSMILEGDYGKLTVKVKDAISRIFESSQKLVLVIEDFLNITRIELGRIKYDVTEWSLNDLVKNVIAEQKPNIEHRGLTMSYEEDEPEYKVYADQGKISQVISNLIDNSVKYTKTGGIKVKVVGKQEGDKKTVLVTITDTGVGIDPATMPNLFKKFSRAEDASKTNIIGTGLGLFVAKQIIDAHHGKIWAESAGKGQGSTFCVELDQSTGVAPVLTPPPAEEGE